ncbi:hypothetical protein LCGC14_2308630 [marine sediment metagenome]|uniref:Uncharacterized protein n=1 Tax=marine sediment metagenome TaxID=412755 RepID=A0A0F9CLA3_9ZZZZ
MGKRRKQKEIPMHVKRKAVADWRAGRRTAEEIGKTLGRSKATVGYWAKNNFPEVERSESGLPTKKPGMRKVQAARAKSLVATAFECPHCGGRVKTEAEVRRTG